MADAKRADGGVEARRCEGDRRVRADGPSTRCPRGKGGTGVSDSTRLLQRPARQAPPPVTANGPSRERPPPAWTEHTAAISSDKRCCGRHVTSHDHHP